MKIETRIILWNNIHYFLKKNNKDVASFEKEIGVSAGYFSRLRLSKYDINPRVETLYKISKLFCVSMEDLLERDLGREERLIQALKEFPEIEKELKALEIIRKLDFVRLEKIDSGKCFVYLIKHNLTEITQEEYDLLEEELL